MTERNPYRQEMSRFYECCIWGELDKMKILKYLNNYTSFDIRSSDNYPIRLACCNGHLDVAKWLTKTFYLNTNDIRSLNNNAFQWACYNEHILVMEWLLNTFLTVDDASEMIKAKNVSERVVEWLKNYVSLGDYTKSAVI